MEFFAKGRNDRRLRERHPPGLQSILVSPRFLFRLEQTPTNYDEDRGGPIASATRNWRRGCRSSCGALVRTPN